MNVFVNTILRVHNSNTTTFLISQKHEVLNKELDFLKIQFDSKLISLFKNILIYWKSLANTKYQHPYLVWIGDFSINVKFLFETHVIMDVEDVHICN